MQKKTAIVVSAQSADFVWLADAAPHSMMGVRLGHRCGLNL